MSIKKIITVPDETLKKISEPIEKVGVNEKKLINDLFETMYNSKGIGLAAVQVGILKRILVIDISAKDEKNAIGATFLFNIAHYALRPWPWILIALSSLIIFPELSDIQKAFPNLPAWCVRIINFITIDKYDNISILLNGS